jgi:putative membrane protein
MPRTAPDALVNRRLTAEETGECNVGAGMVAGFIGGLAATWAMNRFQALWSALVNSYQSQSAAGSEDARDWQERNEGGNANELFAQAVATRAIDRRLTRDELKVAAPIVHYAFGSGMGALYGAVAEVIPSARALAGTAYGTSVWIGADEVAVPLMGLSKRNGELPAEAHVQSFASHLVFGFATEAVRRAVRRAIG